MGLAYLTKRFKIKHCTGMLAQFLEPILKHARFSESSTFLVSTGNERGLGR